MPLSLIAVHLGLALILFILVNWVGSKAVSIGYVEFSHFTDKLESPIFNFVFRIVSPLIFLTLASAVLYGLELDIYVDRIYFVIIYYFSIRWGIICILMRNQLTNWWRQLLIASLTIFLSYLLYSKLLVFKKNILPDPGELANELWIIIILFIYNITNKITFRSNGMFDRVNNYVLKKYTKFKKLYGEEIDKIITNEKLKSLTYAIMIYEDFNRPPVTRSIEYLSFWLTKRKHSLGVMQVQTEKYISNKESVRLGALKIQNKYLELKKNLPVDQQDQWTLKSSIIGDFNGGEKYLYQVNSIEDNLSIQVFNDPSAEL